VALAGAVVMAALAPTAGPALGLGDAGVEAVSVPQLQTQAQLPQTPDASVPVPSVPQVSTPSVPSAPSVPQAPSAPSVPQVSAPTVRTPSASVPSTSTSGQSTQSAPGSSPASSGPSAPQSSQPGAAPQKRGASGSRARVAPHRSAQAEPHARARQRAHERHVRAEIRRFSSCLGSLAPTVRSYLSLRAGLEGPPLSRGQAADRSGIPRAQARGVERRGLRKLRSACGGGGSTRAHPIATTTSRMPSFQPASLLAATGGSTTAPQLVDQRQLGKQQLNGEHATSPPPSEAPKEAAITSHPVASASSGGIDAAWIAILAALALMAAVATVVLRGRRDAQPAVLIAPAPARQPDPEPEPQPEPPQPAPAAITPPPAPPEPRGHDYRRAARPAAMIASGILSFAARELMRRRRGERRRR
jgi:hypothetical protein